MQESLAVLQERLKKNWRKAFAEVGTSVFGSIGIVFGISFVMQLDSEYETTWSVFASYFDGGELSLSRAPRKIALTLRRRYDGIDGPSLGV